MRFAARSTFIRFVIAGIINTLFSWGVYSTCILLSVSPWLSLIIGNLSGIAFNFVSLGGYAFRDLALARLPRFVSCYLVLYMLNLGLLKSAAPWLPNLIWAQLVLSLPMALLSYLMMSRFVFKARTG